MMDETLKSALVDAVIAMAAALPVALFATPKYGGTVFLTDPDKPGSTVAGVFASAAHVSVEFSKGAMFDDPASLLDGKGKVRRHVKLFGMADIQSKNVAGFLGQAVTR